MAEPAPDEDLSSKVSDWLGREGYPLEYFAAHAFRKFGFRVEQGAYVKTPEGEPREVDVLASMAKFQTRERPMARVYTVVECKWTRSKPWVAFTAKTGQMASSALIAQALASELGEAVLHLEVGDEALQRLPLFGSPEHPGFGGRQALSKESDVFYNAIRSVAGAARNLADRYNVYRGDEGLPEAAVFTFPIIVIDGDLFEASYDDDADGMNLARVTQTRLHWRGSKDSNLRTTVDVVTKSGLEAFIEQRAHDTKALLDVVFARANELTDCFRRKSIKGLVAKSGPTGTSGGPPFLQSLYERASKAQRDAEATARIAQHRESQSKVV